MTPDVGKYYERERGRGDDVVKVTDVDDGTVTYEMVEPPTGHVSKLPVDDFELIWSECGKAASSFAGP